MRSASLQSGALRVLNRVEGFGAVGGGVGWVYVCMYGGLHVCVCMHACMSGLWRSKSPNQLSKCLGPDSTCL